MYIQYTHIYTCLSSGDMGRSPAEAGPSSSSVGAQRFLTRFCCFVVLSEEGCVYVMRV